MNAEINDGGPAFPRPPFTPKDSHDQFAQAGFAATGHPGMSLRDWFAGQALAAIPHIGCGCDLKNEEFAKAAYQIADAMLAARKEESK